MFLWQWRMLMGKLDTLSANSKTCILVLFRQLSRYFNETDRDANFEDSEQMVKLETWFAISEFH